MEGKRLFRTLHLQNLLSFGPESEEITLEPLNVLIGPNASGKSNLIESMAILRATPKDLTAPIREGGGMREWLWKGARTIPIAKVEATVEYPEGIMPLRYRLCMTLVGQRPEIVDEAVENEHPSKSDETETYFFYRFQGGNPVLNVRTAIGDQARAGTDEGRTKRHLRREDLSPEQSILSQRKDPDQYPEITYLGDQFSNMRLYREWNLGRYTAPRMPQKADLPDDFLLEDASNLGLILNDLQNRSGTRQVLLEKFRQSYEGVEDITTKVQGGTIQIFVHEEGLTQPIPATCLSDGSLRYLCLLTLLCHPTPPPLLCIEEPELGLHPDVLTTVAELLVEASKRTQLIVTTHSDALVSALTDTPESVLVFEHDARGPACAALNPCG